MSSQTTSRRGKDGGTDLTVQLGVRKEDDGTYTSLIEEQWQIVTKTMVY